MTRPTGRLWAFFVVALLAWGAITVMRPLPDRKPGVVLQRPRVPQWVERDETLGTGETITSVLQRSGLTEDEARGVVSAASGDVDVRRLPAGMRITVGATEDSSPSRLVLHLGVDRLLRLTKGDSGWVAREERIPWTTDTMVVAGTIASNLYDAFDVGGRALPKSERTELAWSVADVFEYRLDMSRDLQPGDAFAVLLERRQTRTGEVRLGAILGVDYSSGGKRLRVIRLADTAGKGRFFEESGKSMAAMFLRAPLEFRRISSVFGMRKHPILGVVRAHRGTDYAASSGTPVRSIGDGVVQTAGRMSGFGNVIEVRHPNGYVSRYGHLRGFAASMARGARVSIGQTIGYVGMTGLATAPHLHFELLVGGVQKNPRVALESSAGYPIAATERLAFEQARAEVALHLDSLVRGVVRDSVREF